MSPAFDFISQNLSLQPLQSVCVCIHRWCVEAGQLDESSLVQTAASELNPEDQELLKAYHHSFDDEKVDLDLILHLLSSIYQSSDEGETSNLLS